MTPDRAARAPGASWAPGPSARVAMVLAALLAPGLAWADRGLATGAAASGDRGGAFFGAQVGGLVPVNALGGSYYVQVEAGYLLPFLRRLLSVSASAAFASPTLSGTASDPRLSGTSYQYSVDQRQAIFGLTATARVPLGRLIPFIGVGPRFTLVRSDVSGQTQNGLALAPSSETSTEIGVGVPLGLEVRIGPGRLFAEGQFLWSPIAQRATGPSSLSAVTVAVGYRLVL